MLLLVATFIAIALCQTPPTLSDDFTGEIMGDFVRRGHQRHFEGTWFVDHTGKQHKFVEHGKRTEDLFRFWNSTTGGWEYAYSLATKACHKAGFSEPFYGLWDFLPHAKSNGMCDHLTHPGSRWTERNANFEIDACISADGRTPFWVDVRVHSAETHVWVGFHSWTPGRPAASNFVLPTTCPK